MEEQILPEDNFHILPVNLATIPDDDFYTRLYSKATLPGNTYSWQKEPVETLAVQSFLFTVEDDDCQKVTPVATLIKNNLSWLQENGKPEWKEVSFKPLNDQQPERVSKCVKD